MTASLRDRRVLVTGAGGKLGPYVVEALVARGARVTAWTGSRTGEWCGLPLEPVELADASLARRRFAVLDPEVVIHAAALAAVAACHADPARARAVNAEAPGRLADLCRESGARFVFVGTDMVFDGEGAPYAEDDPPTPVTVYGRSKAEGEAASRRNPTALVVRVPLLLGRARLGPPGFFESQVEALREGRPVRLFEDEWRTPITHADAAEALADLAATDAAGVVHVSGPRRMSRYEMGLALARALGVLEALVQPIRRADVAGPEPRQRDLSLAVGRWRELCPLARATPCEEALGHLV